MAVSMLAGCSGNPSDGEEGTDVVVTGPVAGVIAALDSDTTEKVTFTSSESLQNALNKLVKNAGNDSGDVTASELVKIDSSLGKEGCLAFVDMGQVSSEKTDKEAATVVKVVKLDQAGLDETYAMKALAQKIDAEAVYYTNAANTTAAACEKLPEQSKTYTDDGDEYWYNFDYTGNVAVAEVTDAVSGQSYYVAAFTVTRTPTRVDK